jgi:hypothetical protein
MIGKGLAAWLRVRAGDDQEIVVRMLLDTRKPTGRARLDATGLAVAGLLLLAAVWPRRLDAGPSLPAFYETFGGGPAVEVGRQMLAELLETIETNERVIRAHKPEMLIERGLVLIVLSLAGAIPVALLG